jgi:hypothetical protein
MQLLNGKQGGLFPFDWKIILNYETTLLWLSFKLKFIV